MIQQDPHTDEKLEPAIDAFRRAVAQARLRAVRQGIEDGVALAKDLLIAPCDMDHILPARFHGHAWAQVQAVSPVLHRRRVAFVELDREIRIALGLRDKLRSDNAAAPHRLAAFTPDA